MSTLKLQEEKTDEFKETDKISEIAELANKDTKAPFTSTEWSSIYSEIRIMGMEDLNRLDSLVKEHPTGNIYHTRVGEVVRAIYDRKISLFLVEAEKNDIEPADLEEIMIQSFPRIFFLRDLAQKLSIKTHITLPNQAEELKKEAIYHYLLARILWVIAEGSWDSKVEEEKEDGIEGDREQ